MAPKKAQTQAAMQQPVVTPEPAKQKKAKGGFYGVGEVMPATVDPNSTRRGVFLGG